MWVSSNTIKNSEQKTPEIVLARERRKGGFGVRRNVIRCVWKDAKGNKEMERIYSIDELRRILLPVFVLYGVKRAILFGSYGNGCATEKSDVDLLVDSGLRGLRFVEFTEALRSALGKDIDVFDVSHIEPHSRIELEIRETGVLFYEM